jgi:hypothetical protein
MSEPVNCIDRAKSGAREIRPIGPPSALFASVMVRPATHRVRRNAIRGEIALSKRAAAITHGAILGLADGRISRTAGGAATLDVLE